MKKNITIYDKLSRVLDRIPNGFPNTEDGIHLKILQKIYTPEEAEIASKMKLKKESVEKIAKKVKKPVDYMKKKLWEMFEKGQIRRGRTPKGILYGLLPFVVGVYEDQLERLDKELAELVEAYIHKTKLRTILDAKPSQFKVIPVKQTIKTDLIVHPYQDAEKLLRKAKSWGIRECICKKQQKLIDNSCRIGDSSCIVFSNNENEYDDTSRTQAVSLEKAIAVLKEAEEKGFVHCTMNAKSQLEYICNCCTCCCGILRTLTEFAVPDAIVSSDYVMSIDEEKCYGCANCIDRCQFNALELINNVIKINKKCIGCGVCALVCPEEALHLIPRKSKELPKSPKSATLWYIKRMFKRKIIPRELLF